MDLQTGDYIIVRDWDKNNFFRNKYYKDLENKPTRVWDWGDGRIFIAHPHLDLVELHDDVVYDKIINTDDLPDHKGYKNKVKEFSKLTTGQDIKSEKPLLKFLKKKSLKEEQEKTLSKNDEKIINLIGSIENGEFEVGYLDKMFGSLDNFINLLKKRNLLEYINPYDSAYEEIQNKLFYEIYFNDNNFVWELVDKFMSDAIKIGNDYYLQLDEDDLSDFFETSWRNDVSKESIKQILSGEYNFDFWDLDANEYEDVYDDLVPENKKIVDNVIVSELKNIKKLDVTSKTPSLIDKIALEQGNEGEIQLNDDVISRLMDDDECIEYLIMEEFPDDIKSNLYSLYSSCYSGTLYDEWYDDLMNELEGYIIDSRNAEDFSYEKETWDKEGKRIKKTFYARRYKATNCIYDIISGWLYDNKDKNGYSQNSLDYFGSIAQVLKDSTEYGSKDKLRVPNLSDYPDHTKVDNCMNENVGDYF
jgi:hypothetical protein